MRRPETSGRTGSILAGIAAAFAAALLPLSGAMAQEDKPEVLHCARMAHAVKSGGFARFGVQLKRYRTVAGFTRVNLAYAGIDSDGAGMSGAFECRYKAAEVRQGTYKAVAVFVDSGRLTRDALDKYNALVDGQ
ncbi:MAG: hypothetical protein RJQ21_20260 [Rhodospirillales bacterium]